MIQTQLKEHFMKELKIDIRGQRDLRLRYTQHCPWQFYTASCEVERHLFELKREVLV